MPDGSWLLAQLSDPHILEPGRLLNGSVDTAALLAAAVAHLSRLDPLPDAVLVTGDLVDSGWPAQYERLRALLAPLPMPVHLLPGNHDDRVALREAFPEQAELHVGPWADFAVPGPVQLLCLDTLREGEPGGHLAPSQVAWLDARLAEAPGTPALVALHHPPFATGIDHMDAMALDATSTAMLAEVVSRHPQVERVVSGHVHRLVVRRWHGTVACIAPSVATSIRLGLNPSAAPAWDLEPPAFLLHHWTPAGGLVTHLQPVGDFPGRPFI